MELVICFGFAVSTFILVILSIIGLVNAPTPILLCILICGVMITQRTINRLAEPEINLREDKDKVELLQDHISTKSKKEIAKSMVYRGSHYISSTKGKSANHLSQSKKLKYRGVELNSQKVKNV